MRASKQGFLSFRTQALIVFTVVAVWYADLWMARRSGERFPALADVLLFFLPILSTVLSYLALDARIRNRQPADRWFYAAFLGGLMPYFLFWI